MNIKFFLSTIAGMAIAMQTLFAQSVIKGKVTDATNQSPVSYASVVLLKPDSSFVSGASSDLEGMFEIKNIPNGSYILSTSFVGYEKMYAPVNLQENNEFINISLKPSAITLGEVTIQARSVIHKADRTLVLPSETQVKTSTGGIDLLQKLQLPRIYIDPVSEDVSTSGNGEVQLRLNGVQVTRAEISALRPVDIQRIEYHDNPGARYGKAAAVIDYITARKTESGGSMKGVLNSHHDFRTSTDQLSFQYNHGKSEFSANADYAYRKTYQTTDYDEHFIYPDHELQRVETGEPTPYIRHVLNTTVNYSLTEKDKYFFNARLRYGLLKLPYSLTDHNSTQIAANDTRSIYDHASENNYFPALDIYFQRNLKNNQLLIFNAVGTQIKSDYSRVYREKQASNTPSELFSDISGNKYSLIAEGIYEKRTTTGVFTGGVKHTQAYTENQYRGTTGADVSMIQAESYIYAEYQLKQGKWGYMANLAGERFYFHSSKGIARNASTERFALLPAARVTFAPNSDWNFRYSANLQNTIPSLAYLNDVEQQIDPLQVRRGNPDLQSFQTLAQNLNIGYGKKAISIDLLLGYNYEFNPVMESVFYENGLFVRTYENQKNFQTLSVEPTVKLKPWKNYLTITVAPRFSHFVSNGNAYSHTFNLTNLRVHIDGYYKNWFANILANTPPHMNYFYGEQSATSTMVSAVAIGYKQKNWSLLVGMMNPLGIKLKMTGENFAALNPAVSDAWNDGMKQKITFRFTWNLDFGKQVKGVNRRIENKDENSGIMSGGKE